MPINTGYAGATTNAYAAGAVIINEIMWGLDGTQAIADQKQSQYIELHNTTATAAITIDSLGMGNHGWQCFQHLDTRPLIRSATTPLLVTGQCRVTVV